MSKSKIDNISEDDLYKCLLFINAFRTSERYLGGDADIRNEKFFENYLDTAGIPDPDLLIRTSGELRLSNFLLWQLAYTEFYFTDIYWPDFDREELIKAFEKYNKTERRFGGVKEE